MSDLPALPDDLEQAISMADGDPARLRVLEELADAARRYAITHDQRVAASRAKAKIAREGGRSLIRMAEHGERDAGKGGDRRSRSRAGSVKLADLNLTSSRSSRWQAVARMTDEEFAALLERLAADELAGAHPRGSGRPAMTIPAGLRCDIRLGDFREVLADIPNGSLDLILTDPPYPKEFLPLWSDLGAFAMAKLAPHGVLAAMSGQAHLPEVIARLGTHLTYRWTMAYLATGHHTIVHGRRVLTAWKPVLVYGSSERRLFDLVMSRAPDKEYHGWGQSESGMADLLAQLADAGATVCDPFLGGGTTAVVALAHGCHFIGAEIDDKAFAVAQERLAA